MFCCRVRNSNACNDHDGEMFMSDSKSTEHEEIKNGKPLYTKFDAERDELKRYERSKSTEEIERLEVKLVEFALAAHKLLKEDKFFDDGGDPREGSDLVKSTARQLFDQEIARRVEEDRNAFHHVHYDGNPIKHDVPCQDCGSTYWPDWLVPHGLFNRVCPGGNGYLCLPCFSNRLADLNNQTKEKL